MATGFTEQEIAELERELEENTPPIPTDARKTARRVVAMKCSATEYGALFNLGTKDGRSVILFFHVVVARELAGAINEANQAYNWAKKGLISTPSSHLPHPAPDDLEGAPRVIGVATYATPAGVLANVVIQMDLHELALMTLFFPRPVAMEFLNYVVRAGRDAAWWDDEFNLIAKRLLH